MVRLLAAENKDRLIRGEAEELAKLDVSSCRLFNTPEMRVSRGFYLFVLTFGTLLTAFQLYFTRPPLLAWLIMAVALAICWFIGLKRSGWPWGHRK